MSNRGVQCYKTGHFPSRLCFKLIVVKCIVGAGDGPRCGATEGSVEQRCAAVTPPCQVKFAASCAGPAAVLSTSDFCRPARLCAGAKVQHSPESRLMKTYRDIALMEYCLFFFPLLQLIKCQALLNKLLSAGVLPGTAFRDIYSIACVFGAFKYHIRST